MSNFVESKQAAPGNDTQPHTSPGIKLFIGCAIAFILCVLLNVTPLNRLVGTGDAYHNVTDSILLIAGTWLPLNLGFSPDSHSSQIATHLTLFLILLTLEFVLYGISAWWARTKADKNNYKSIIRVTWIVAIITGIVFVLTPAMLSHDAFVYAGYGRVLALHHANPYFVTLTAFPHDPLLPFDDWKNAPAAYGPFWLAICGLGALIAGDHSSLYILLYRTLGLVAHLLNIWLINRILQRTDQNPRTITMGTLLYAWNPLILQEGIFGGHNDVVMVSCTLTGILLGVQAEQKAKYALLSFKGYAPVIIAFTLATLIKFTGAPLIALFLVLLARLALLPEGVKLSRANIKALHWKATLSVCLPAALLSIGIILFFYLPYWDGHSIASIIYSFTSPPSANTAYASILAAYQAWIKLYGVPQHNWFLMQLSYYKTWGNINTVTMILLIGAGIIYLWRKPIMQTLVLTTIAILGTLLIITPWFFPWYVMWITGLAPLCLLSKERISQSLLAFALTFSASANLFYFFYHQHPRMINWIGFNCLATIGPPIAAFLLVCALSSFQGQSTSAHP